jgi:hypothetical protein
MEMTMSGDFVTLSEWETYCREERRKYWKNKDRENAKLQEKFNRELDRLLNPPPPPPRPVEPEEPDIDDNSYADWLYVQGGGATGEEIRRGQELHEENYDVDD